MSISDIFRGEKTVTENTPVGLTAVGKQKADNFDGDGALFVVLATIAENGGVATIREIAQDTRMTPDKVQSIVKRLIKSGYVKVQRG